MTEQELLEWGRKESEMRQRDLESVTDEASLKVAQNEAKKRRSVVGLSAGQAALWVRRADVDTLRT
jgi:cysteine synthase